MQKKKTQHQQIIDLVMMSLLTAFTILFSCLGSFIPIGGTSLNLALVPVILGAAMYGKYCGGWLGFVSGAFILITGQAAWFLTFSIAGTIITVLVKGFVSGFLAGFIYELLRNYNKLVAMIVCAAVCPIVNTSIFLLGCFTFFYPTMASYAHAGGVSVVAYVFTTFVTINFVVELIVNVVLGPTLHRIINIWYKEKA